MAAQWHPGSAGASRLGTRVYGCARQRNAVPLRAPAAATAALLHGAAIRTAAESAADA